MLITARLSRTLSETLGDEAAGDMVAWMHSVDDHRMQLRELHELGAARIDARFDQVEGRFRQIDARFEQIDARFEQIDARFERMDARFEQMRSDTGSQIAASEARLDARLELVETRVNGRIDALTGELKSRIDQRFADLIKWSFVFWCGAVAAALWGR